ncbi:hypothetical protein H8356DRAFT_1283757 [Neocallimastix lanati (nom. inval.)]|nr:hypothetical protein H8356DRAFT_1283757 [Neocallimastix sp. JGI-2020a]
MTYTGKNHSGGKNWPLQLKDLHNMTLWNYSMGGSLIDIKLINDCKWCKNDLREQYSYFYENMLNNKFFYQKWNSNNSLFVIFTGHNDMKKVRRENIEMDISNITNGFFNIIEDLYNVGARNILIFELLPVYRGPARYRFYKKVKKEDVLMFNNYIKINAKNFFNKHSNANIIIYNILERVENIIDNCYMFGFKDCTNAYKNNETENIRDYLWKNSHLSEQGNKILTNDIDSILSSLNEEK